MDTGHWPRTDDQVLAPSRLARVGRCVREPALHPMALLLEPNRRGSAQHPVPDGPSHAIPPSCDIQEPEWSGITLKPQCRRAHRLRHWRATPLVVSVRGHRSALLG